MQTLAFQAITIYLFLKTIFNLIAKGLGSRLIAKILQFMCWYLYFCYFNNIVSAVCYWSYCWFLFCLDLQYSDSGSSELEEVEQKVAAEAMVQLAVRPPYQGEIFYVIIVNNIS